MNPQLAKKIIPGPMTESLVCSTVEDEEMVCKMIHESMPQLEVIEMQTVKNTFLEAMYLLKKEEYKSRYGRVPEEKLLFHVTAASNVDSIISNNFDWRRTSRGKFGLGTSFSGDAGYANRYANYNIGDERAIIVTKVLVSKTTAGHYGMKTPHKKYDTATGNGNKVYVKFGDNEILPKYIVFYNSSVSQANKNIKKKSTQKKQQTDSKSSNANTNNAIIGEVFNNYDDYDYDNGEYGSDEYEDEYDEDEEDVYDEDCEDEDCEDEEDEYDEDCEDEEDEYDEDCEEEFCEEEEYEDEYDENCEEEEDCEEEENEYDYHDEDCEEEEEDCGEEEDDYDYYNEDCEEESDNYYY